jgi:hypothetical protein
MASQQAREIVPVFDQPTDAIVAERSLRQFSLVSVLRDVLMLFTALLVKVSFQQFPNIF